MEEKTFGQRLFKLRKQLGKTQDELRDEIIRRGNITIGQSYISELERDMARPSLEMAAELARVLNSSIDYLGLLTADSGPRQIREPAPYFDHSETDIVARLMDDLTDEKRVEILMVVRQMAIAAQNTRSQRIQEFSMQLDLIEQISGPAARIEFMKGMRDAGLGITIDEQGSNSLP